MYPVWFPSKNAFERFRDFLKTLKLSEWPSFRDGSTAFRVSIGFDGLQRMEIIVVGMIGFRRMASIFLNKASRKRAYQHLISSWKNDPITPATMEFPASFIICASERPLAATFATSSFSTPISISPSRPLNSRTLYSPSSSISILGGTPNVSVGQHPLAE